MTVDEILNSLLFTDRELVFMFRSIILLFELIDSDDKAFHIFDPRIQNYCKNTGLEIIPLATVSDVDAFCREPNKLIAKYKSGFIVFSHSGRNQLRQLVQHMRNACSHARLRIVTKKGEEYIEFKAIDPKKKVKLLALIQRKQFRRFWDTVIKTIKLN